MFRKLFDAVQECVKKVMIIIIIQVKECCSVEEVHKVPSIFFYLMILA